MDNKSRTNTVTVGVIGAGFAAALHGEGYLRVHTVPVRLKTISDINLDRANAVAAQYGFEQAVSDYHEILADPEIEVVDLVTPPFLHRDMILEALAAGKHVICEKPITGYFGKTGEAGVGHVSKKEMYEAVCAELETIRAAAEKAGRSVMYAENYVYATPVVRAAQLIEAKKSKILFMKGEESTPGSMTAGAGRWSLIGGGALQRIGCHPLGGMLYLKQVEARARGEEIRAVSVLADTGNAMTALKAGEKHYLKGKAEDVEDFGTLTVTFSDGSKCIMIATDLVLGGTKNYIEVYGSDSAYQINLTPTDMLNTYFVDDQGLENERLSEMLDYKTGWNKAFVSDEVIRGYMDELADFMEAASEGRRPKSDLDLAREVTRILYAGYVSAEEERRVYL